ncbi:1275_t:CDS:2 [Acaulospora colombiana]|uniref:1275_t:CDS:1 n=1 Tax=Acaulospora colombiana TaxID=27376 RepID=A0ACA9KNP1_9GLOM|nr:1275_t:CDS:2 [Acaulospora colombiana]
MSSETNDPIYLVALSPDGNNVVVLNSENLELRVYRTDDLTKMKKISYLGLNIVKNESSRLTWSLAISNSINLGSHSDSLIAISCFNENDNLLSQKVPRRGARRKSRDHLTFDTREESSEHLNLLEEGSSRSGFRPHTWIISTWFQNRLTTSLDNMGGVIRFLTTTGNHTTFVIVHSMGITTTEIDHNYERADLSFNPKSSISPTDDYFFPAILTDQITTDEVNFQLHLFHRSVEKNYFLVEDYGSEVLEMYNLTDGELFKIFYTKVGKNEVVNGTSIFEVSKNDVFLAYCRGTNSVSIYLMENTLEVATKIFEDMYRINSIDFISDDEKLLLVGEEEKVGEDSTTELITVILVWDLFSESENSIRKIEDIQRVIPAKPHEHYHKFASASGKIVYVNEDDGSVCSVFDHPGLTTVLNAPPPTPIVDLVNLNMQAFHSGRGSDMYHYLYRLDGQLVDAKKEPKSTLIVSNPEPWVRFKKYPRVSAYLNEEKTQQVIIGYTTVQVWRRKGKPKPREILQYIWSSPEGKNFQIINFSTGSGRFFLEVSVGPEGDHYQIRWPHSYFLLVDACKALGHLYGRCSDQLSPKKQYIFDRLNQQIARIIKKFIKKSPEIWRLIEVRYEIMESLIRGNCVSLIRLILFEEDKKKNKTRTSKQLHFPRLYAWPRTQKKSDLEVAIECAGNRWKDTIIVGYLLNYYADNAMKNAGWMFSVSQALPSLYDHHLGIYLCAHAVYIASLHPSL